MFEHNETRAEIKAWPGCHQVFSYLVLSSVRLVLILLGRISCSGVIIAIFGGFVRFSSTLIKVIDGTC